MNAVTIFEGPDGGGKTTLADRWGRRIEREGRNFNKVNNGPYLGMTGDFIATLYLSSMCEARPAKDKLIDRAWTSESIYGPVARGINRIEVPHRRILERAALSHQAIQVVCLPPFEKCRQAYMDRKEIEYLEDETQLRSVWDGFSNLLRLDAQNNCAIPTYLYDYTCDEVNRASWLDMMEQLRPPQNTGPGYGHHRKDDVTLIVYEVEQPLIPYMWVEPAWRFLSNSLEEFGISERSLYWVPAIRSDGSEMQNGVWLENLAPKRIVAMGALAWMWCKRNAVSGNSYREIPSHDWWYTYKREYRFDPLRDAL